MTPLFIVIIIAPIIILFIVIASALAKHYRLHERKRSRQLKIINKYRRMAGLVRLKVYYELDKIAKNHSYYMAKHRTCNHNGFSQRTDKVRRIVGASMVAENCYKFPARKYNSKVAEKLVKGWMKSSGHRHNIMNPGVKKIGIGIVTKKGYVYATQIFTD